MPRPIRREQMRDKTLARLLRSIGNAGSLLGLVLLLTLTINARTALCVSVNSLCLCGEPLSRTLSPQRHRGRTETRRKSNLRHHPVHAQNTSTPDPEMARVKAMIDQAKKDSDEFSKSGGKPADANNPNLKWSAAFWGYREKHPGTPATVTATAEALRLLNRADRLSELQAKADTLKPDDAVWKQVFYTLMSAASKSKDYSYLISKAEALTQTAADTDIKAQARFTIGDAYWRTKDIDRARKAFQ